MDTKDHFLQMFNYDQWANRESLTALHKANPPLEKAVRLLAHTLSSQKVWLERLQRVPQSAAVWPSSTLQDCSALADEMRLSWNRYLTELTTDGLEQQVDYRNSKGESWSSRVEDILTHVLMHSAYHRGQIALEMRAAGQQPAYTDFIHGVRQGLIG
jgi:uncharacterized damage-inducible protein DinB